MAQSPEGGHHGAPEPVNLAAENAALKDVISLMAEDAREMHEALAHSAERWERIEGLMATMGADEAVSAIAGHPAPETLAAPAGAPAAPEADGGKGFLSRIGERVRPARRIRAIATAGVLAVGGVLGGIGGSADLNLAHASGSSHGGAITAKNNKHKSSGSSTATKPSTHQRMLAHAESADTVSVAVARMYSTPETIKSNIHSIFNEQHTQRLNHDRGSMSSLRAEFGDSDAGALNYAEDVAFSIKGSPAFAAKMYNEAHGNRTSTALPDGVSHEEALKYLEAKLTARGTMFSVQRPTGTRENHGQRGENIFDAGRIELNGSEDVFTITFGDGTKVEFKVFNNNCTNILDVVPEEVVVPPAVVTPVAPAPAPAPVVHPNHPKPKHRHPRHTTTTRHPHPGTSTPTTPTPKTPKTPTTPPPSTPPHHTPKTDHNTTPGGVPGEPHGTGPGTPTTGPGVGPIEQPTNPQGFVPGENQPPAQPQEPTPAPVEAPPTPTPPSPPETGQDNGPGQPPAPSTGTGTTVTGGLAAPAS